MSFFFVVCSFLDSSQCYDVLVQLYFGLLIFVGYMVADTQEIIEKAHLGDMDYEKHSLTLFTDFVAVFIRILIIMVSSFVAGVK